MAISPNVKQGADIARLTINGIQVPALTSCKYSRGGQTIEYKGVVQGDVAKMVKYDRNFGTITVSVPNTKENRKYFGALDKVNNGNHICKMFDSLDNIQQANSCAITNFAELELNNGEDIEVIIHTAPMV